MRIREEVQRRIAEENAAKTRSEEKKNEEVKENIKREKSFRKALGEIDEFTKLISNDQGIQI